MLEVIIAIILSSFFSTIFARLWFDHRSSSDIGAIVIDENEIYLAFNDNDGPEKLKKLGAI